MQASGVPSNATARCTWPNEAARAAVGLGSVFLHLQAKINWHRLFHELIDDFDEQVLARRQRAALKRAAVPPPA